MGVLLHSYFQVSPEMFDRVQVRALAGPLKDFQRLLGSEPFPQADVLSALDEDLIKDLYLLLTFPSILTSHLVPAAEKHPLSMMLPQTCFTVGKVLAKG